MDNLKSIKTSEIQSFINREESNLQSMFKEYMHLLRQERKAYIFYEINPNVNSNRSSYYSAHNKLEEFSNDILLKWSLINDLRNELHLRQKQGKK